MNSEDVRNDPRMKAHWNKLARERRMIHILTWGSFAILAALILTMATLGGCRWPIIIKGGGHGDDSTVEGGK